jgi:hypothetical protein
MVAPLHGQSNGVRNPGGLGTGQEDWEAQPLEQQVQQARPLEASVLGNGLGIRNGVKSLAGSKYGRHYLGFPQDAQYTEVVQPHGYYLPGAGPDLLRSG